MYVGYVTFNDHDLIERNRKVEGFDVSFPIQDDEGVALKDLDRDAGTMHRMYISHAVTADDLAFDDL